MSHSLSVRRMHTMCTPLPGRRGERCHELELPVGVWMVSLQIATATGGVQLPVPCNQSDDRPARGRRPAVRPGAEHAQVPQRLSTLNSPTAGERKHAGTGVHQNAPTAVRGSFGLRTGTIVKHTARIVRTHLTYTRVCGATHAQSRHDAHSTPSSPEDSPVSPVDRVAWLARNPTLVIRIGVRESQRMLPAYRARESTCMPHSAPAPQGRTWPSAVALPPRSRTHAECGPLLFAR